MPDVVQLPENVPIETYYTDEQLYSDEDDPDEINPEENHDVTIETDNGVLDPVYVKTYGGDSYGKHTTLNDGCGNTRTRNGGSTGFQITIEGILTLNQLRDAREYGLHEGARITIDLQPWTDEYICDNFTWDKPNNLNQWVSDEYPNGVEAFTFQLKTKGEESDS